MLKGAHISDAKQAAELALLLWPDNELSDFIKEMEQFISKEDAFIVLAYDQEEAIGFAQCQLRYDYVEGTDSSPVGYLEGLYVKDTFRNKGTARQLVEACEGWVKEKGCIEFASDCELTNLASAAMHLKLGFEEANRIICFKKNL